MRVLFYVFSARHAKPVPGPGRRVHWGARGNFFGRSSKTPLFWLPEKCIFPRTTRFRFKPSERRTVPYGGRCDSAHGGAPLRCLSAPRLAKIWGFSGQRAHARVFCACRRLWPARGHCINCNISRSIARMHLIFLCDIDLFYATRSIPHKR